MIDLTELYVEIDDFCRKFCDDLNQHLVGNGKTIAVDTPGLNLSEVLTILIYYHFSKFDCLKHYYLIKMRAGYKKEFPKLPLYNRFVERIKEVWWLAALYLQYRQVKFSGMGYIDSTPLKVSHNKRTNSHKVFKFVATLGKSSMGWFYGFKLHIICDLTGNIIKCNITHGAANDLKTGKEMMKDLNGKIFADKGYIGKKEFLELLNKGLILVTGIKKKMKNRLLEMWDKVLLKKRSLIESIFNVMKNSLHLEHSRHRSVINAGVYYITTVIAYTWKPNKPAVKFNSKEIKLLQSLSLMN
ncbi:MAG: IS982 family transposase [Microcystis sp. M122S2]|uniref:IS982 family transposase n=1 Tax=Microcystis sp. M122S2 TaxID=2771142 RepID=UPI00258CB860|nr:IS982 family transposase [Microcystis sp. M122S2]MCA2773577.1 IS982 family transposase [Microcystis sp. M122S2]